MLQVVAQWFCGSLSVVIPFTQRIPEAARPFASIGVTTIRKQPRQGNNIDHQTNGNRLAARFSVGSDSVHSEDSRSTKGNPSEERTHKSARRQPLSQERQRSGMGATKARPFRSLPLGSLLALIPFPLRIPEAARPFASMEATPIRKQPRQGLSIFAAWVLRWLRFLSLRGFLHHQGRGVRIDGSNNNQGQPRQGNNVDYRRNGNGFACCDPITKSVGLSLYYKL